MKQLTSSILLCLILHTNNFCTCNGECTASFQLSTKRCTHEVFQDSIGWNTARICDVTHKNKANIGKCQNSTSCRRNLRVSVFDQQLYSITMKNTFMRMLTGCCEDCALCNVKEIEDTLYVNKTILQSSDVIFPVLGESTAGKMHGFYFLPSYQVPSSYYFTLKKSSTYIVGEVVLACVNLWPFLLICILFAFISGFFVWVLEHRWNEEDFQRRFVSGLLDGFWWSFISMTTVGYGDKVTKTIQGKVYAVFWILIGITMCSMFTATLTTEIIDARAPANTDLAGNDVAVMKGRTHDLQIVSEKGAVIRMGTIGHTMRGIDEMINLLQNRTVSGFVVDRNTHYHFVNRINTSKKYKYIKDKLAKMDMVRTEKKHAIETLSCGMLIRNKDDYDFFKAYFDNNRLDIRSCNSMRMNRRNMDAEEPDDMFSSDSEVFEHVFTYSVLIVFVMIIIGVLVEVRRCLIRRKNTKEEIRLNEKEANC